MLGKIETLQHVARPFASFKESGLGGGVWKIGGTYAFRFRVFMFLPFGMHRIEVDRLDATDCVISTRESNRSVPVWNHVITMKALDDGHTAYTDEVVIGAGRKTGIVCIWAKAFYKHRQKRWRRMLNSLADQN